MLISKLSKFSQFAEGVTMGYHWETVKAEIAYKKFKNEMKKKKLESVFINNNHSNDATEFCRLWKGNIKNYLMFIWWLIEYIK